MAWPSFIAIRPAHPCSPPSERLQDVLCRSGTTVHPTEQLKNQPTPIFSGMECGECRGDLESLNAQRAFASASSENVRSGDWAVGSPKYESGYDLANTHPTVNWWLALQHFLRRFMHRIEVPIFPI